MLTSTFSIPLRLVESSIFDATKTSLQETFESSRNND